nr:MAG TPA: hypothetical protein [Caudoviricetes sp.]
MAKEIKVTFESGGVYEGFANTYTLDNSITYYFSFDRDYRVQLTNNAITLQEYRNAGAWYPIDIITKFELAEISGGGTGDATQQWVKDNFVLKSGDTMTGALKFDFGAGVVINLTHTTNSTARGSVAVKGQIAVDNNSSSRVFVVTAGDTAATMNFYRVTNGDTFNDGTIAFRNYAFGGSGKTRSIWYNGINNPDTNDTWKIRGKFETNNNWFFKEGVYFDTWAYWRSNDIINTIIQNNGGIRVYNGQNIAIHEMGVDAEANYYSVYKYNGRDTQSFVGGQDPQYRITGYNNFANSIECYDKITIKTEGQDTARLILSKGYLNTYSASNHRKIYIGANLTIYDDNAKAQYALSTNRFDIYNSNAVICHNGAGGGGTDDVQAAYQYDGIRTYNYSGHQLSINSGGSIRLDSNTSFTAHSTQGMYLNSDRTVSISHGAGAGYDIILINPNGGSVNLTTLYAACNNTFYSESMLNALNACLGHIFDNIGHKYYVEFSGTSYSTGGGTSRGGGVGRK